MRLFNFIRNSSSPLYLTRPVTEAYFILQCVRCRSNLVAELWQVVIWSEITAAFLRLLGVSFCLGLVVVLLVILLAWIADCTTLSHLDFVVLFHWLKRVVSDVVAADFLFWAPSWVVKIICLFWWVNNNVVFNLWLHLSFRRYLVAEPTWTLHANHFLLITYHFLKSAFLFTK